MELYLFSVGFFRFVIYLQNAFSGRFSVLFASILRLRFNFHKLSNFFIFGKFDKKVLSHSKSSN